MTNSMSQDLSTTRAKIELNLGRLSQLFNSFDPSPFHERDLDQDAEEYIVSSAEEVPRQRPLSLVIYLPTDQLPTAGAPISANRFAIILHIAKCTKGGDSVCSSATAVSHL